MPPPPPICGQADRGSVYECKHAEDAGMHVCLCMHVYMRLEYKICSGAKKKREERDEGRRTRLLQRHLPEGGSRVPLRGRHAPGMAHQGPDALGEVRPLRRPGQAGPLPTCVSAVEQSKS